MDVEKNVKKTEMKAGMGRELIGEVACMLPPKHPKQ